MSYGALSGQDMTMQLTAAERDWIRRQGMSARALAAERQLIRSRRTTTRDDVARVREQLRRPPRGFAR